MIKSRKLEQRRSPKDVAWCGHPKMKATRRGHHLHLRFSCLFLGDSYDSSRRFGGSEASLEIGLVLGRLALKNGKI